MDEREADLETTIDDLAETLEALRTELEEPPRGPFGFPRPPTPGEFLRLTEGYAIPALVSLLETSIRTLELLSATIRVADGRPLDGHGTDRRGRDPTRADRLAAASRRTLEKLDEALADVQSAAAGGDPESPELQRLLSEARQLRAEVDDRLAEATGGEGDVSGDSRTIDIDVQSGSDPSSDASDGADDGGGGNDSGDDGENSADAAGEERIDVDSELETIKRELDESGPTSGVRDVRGGENASGHDSTAGPNENEGDEIGRERTDENGADGDDEDDGDSDASDEQ